VRVELEQSKAERAAEREIYVALESRVREKLREVEAYTEAKLQALLAQFKKLKNSPS